MHADHPKRRSDSPDGPIGPPQGATDIMPFDAMTASRAQWDQFHAYRRARHEEASSDDHLLSDQDTEEDECDPDPHGALWRWVAVNRGDIVGSVQSYVQHPGSPGFAERAPFLGARGAVLKPWRRQGIGTGLLARIHRLMLAHGKTILTLSAEEPDGHGFLRHIGASEKRCASEYRLLLDAIDWPAAARWEAIALASLPGSRFVHHGPRVGKDVYQALMPLLHELWDDVPFDQLQHAPVRMDMSEIEESQRRLDCIGGAEHFIMLQDGDGSVIGLTEVVWVSRAPDRVYQIMTGVRRDKRGCGYATALKAAMLREIRARHGSVSKIITHVGQSNAPMVSINRKLGFEVHRQFSNYQIDRDALGAWLDRRCARFRTTLSGS